jgi:hypothetical protein
MTYANEDCITTIMNSIFISNGATFSGCIDLEIKKGWLITKNNSYMHNYNMYDIGSGSVYSLRGGDGVAEENKYIANTGIAIGYYIIFF